MSFIPTVGSIDLSLIPYRERRALVRRIRDEGKTLPTDSKPIYASENDELTLSIKDFGLSLGWNPGLIDLWARRLAAGENLCLVVGAIEPEVMVGFTAEPCKKNQQPAIYCGG